MHNKEVPSDQPGREGNTLPPLVLPEGLAQALHERGDYAMDMLSTDVGTAYVVKAPEMDIASMRGNIPIGVTHALHREPEAPVIRSVVRFYDNPYRAPLSFEVFTNVRDQDQRREFNTFSTQQAYMFVFYNEHLQYRFVKLMVNSHQAKTAELFRLALLASSKIADQQYDFNTARASVMGKTGI